MMDAKGRPDGMAAGSAETIGPFELFVSPVRHWRTLLIAGGCAVVLAAGVSLVLRSRFTASATFMADEESQTRLPPALAGLAGQFSSILTMGGGGDSPEFYADLIRSRSVIRRLLSARVPANGGQSRVIDLLHVKDANPIRRVERAELAMSRRIDVSLDRTTRTVEMKVWMGQPETAAAVSDTILALVDRFNQDIRRTRASEKRRFADQQSAMAADSLHAAENRMAAFLERNRTYQQSAQLAFQHDRIQREIDLRQDLYLALARQAAEARVAELDTRPVLTVIDPPVIPGMRTWPKRTLIVVVTGLVVMVFLWLCFVFREQIQVTIAEGGDVGKAAALLRDAVRSPRRSSRVEDPGSGR